MRTNFPCLEIILWRKMKKFLLNDIEKGLNTAFIDKNYSSNLAYKPQFISNNYKEGRKVLSSIEDELLSCKEFFISVAFITMGGVTPLLQTLKELERRHIPGRAKRRKGSIPKDMFLKMKNFTRLLSEVRI